MPTYTSDPSSIPSAGAWLTTTNAYTSNNTYATNTGATQNTEYPFEIGGFNFASIPAGSVISTVTVTIEGKASNANRAQLKAEVYDGTTLISGGYALTTITATADTNITFTCTPTLAQLKSSTFKIKITNKRTASQACTTSVDYVKVDVVVPTKAHLLTDTFDTLDTATKWNTFGTPSVSGGILNLPCVSNVYSGVGTKTFYDLTESSLYVKVMPPATPGTTRETAVSCSNSGNTYNIGMYVVETAPTLLMRLKQASVNSDATLPYDPVAHAWFRLRIEGSTGYWDTSPDGITWVNRRSAAVTPAQFMAITPELSVGQYTDLGTYPVGYMDNLNIPPSVGSRPKVWTGSAWEKKPAKVWNGSAWVEKPMKVWTGSTWKTLT